MRNKLVPRENVIIGRTYKIDPRSGYVGEFVGYDKSGLVLFKTVKNVDEGMPYAYLNQEGQKAQPGDIVPLSSNSPYPFIETEYNLN